MNISCAVSFQYARIMEFSCMEAYYVYWLGKQLVNLHDQHKFVNLWPHWNSLIKLDKQLFTLYNFDMEKTLLYSNNFACKHHWDSQILALSCTILSISIVSLLNFRLFLSMQIYMNKYEMQMIVLQSCYVLVFNRL